MSNIRSSIGTYNNTGSVETYDSRYIQKTMEGVSVETKFVTTYAAFDSGIGIPYINEKFKDRYPNYSSEYDSLICTDIQSIPIDNENCEVVCFYSNRPEQPAPPKAKDERSWQLSLSSRTDYVEKAFYYHVGSGVKRKWSAVWANDPDNSSYEEEDAPPLYVQENRPMIRLTAYSDVYLPIISSDYIGVINNDLTFHDSLVTTVNADNIDVDLVNLIGTDEYSWMLTDCEIRQLSKGLWEYNITFEFAGYKITSGTGKKVRKTYNEYEGVSNVKIYPTTSFMDLIDKLKGATAPTSGGSDREN